MSDVQAKKMWLPEAMGLMQDLRVENEALRAKVAELEKALNDGYHPNVKRAIKAEGIREMLRKRDYEESTGWIEEYADKLEKGDD